MLTDPSSKYVPHPNPVLIERNWPNRSLERAPIWLSTDLRDGNQALPEPMDVSAKLKMWEMLVAIGFKEIEIGFPSASQVDFDFARLLIEGNHIPNDVTIQVLTPAREELIQRTFESVKGASRAIVHMYNATAPLFRDVVFGLSKPQVVDLAVHHARMIYELAASQPETEWHFQYSPEAFSQTELVFAKEISDAVCEAFQSTPERKMILNLPATVEVSLPNVFADQVEWMDKNLQRREAICLSVHTHNDRGCGVAAAELAQLAGADRVEGCLFGNGERTGNTCLVTLAMNLYSHGIDPKLDFSDIDKIRAVAEEVTKISVHPRHPYAGDLVYTAFSGSHQDAIRKGMVVQAQQNEWRMPYLPIDPADVGRNYRAMVRVNGQSGKGGIAFILEQEYGVRLPREMQVELRDKIQSIVDNEGGEFDAERIYSVTQDLFSAPEGEDQLVGHRLVEDSRNVLPIEATVEIENNGVRHVRRGAGKAPVEAFAKALELSVIDHYEHVFEQGTELVATAYVSIDVEGSMIWAMGSGANSVHASLAAMVAAANRVGGISSRPGTDARATG